MNKKIQIIILLLLPISVICQTINTGKLYVLPGTNFSTVSSFNNTASASFINDGNGYIYNNFNNDGTVDFLDTTGVINFIGSDLQQISGANESYFYNAKFKNSSTEIPYKLLGKISIANEANFIHGIINNKNYNGEITFEDNAIYTNILNDCFVNGKVKKNGDEGFLFPTGDNGTFRPIEISAPKETIEQIEASYINKNSGDVYTHDLLEGIIEYIDTKEYWIVEQKIGTSKVILSLNWDVATSDPKLLAGSKSALHIVRWDVDKGYWVDEGGIVDEVNQTVTTLAEIKKYGAFALARIKEDIVLPGGCLTAYNGLTVNGDGKNDKLTFTCIEKYPDNTVEIFNRYGVRIYKQKGYDNNSKVFRGISKSDLTIGDKKLPPGTYFYILKYKIDEKEVKTSGYLYIN